MAGNEKGGKKEMKGKERGERNGKVRR